MVLNFEIKIGSQRTIAASAVLSHFVARAGFNVIFCFNGFFIGTLK